MWLRVCAFLTADVISYGFEWFLYGQNVNKNLALK